MIFLFPKKKIVVDCFTYNEIALQTSPITNSIKYMPDWWKNLPAFNTPSFYPTSTMKKCVGMIDYYKNSITIPIWSDLAINVNDKNYQWQFSDCFSVATIHPYEERFNFMPEHGHLKLVPHWLLKTKKDIPWVWSQPLYNFSDNISDIKVLPGIISFYHQHGTNINIIFPLNKNITYFIPHGQPMVHLTPLCEGKIKVVRHLVSREEYDSKRASATPISFVNKYKKIIVKQKEFLDCPYHKEK